MPFNGSGVFSAPAASFPAVTGTVIDSAKYNAVINDIATGLTGCITKDGQTTVTANLPMATYKHTGVGNATALTDYASADQVVDNALTHGGASAAGTDTYAVSLAVSPGAYAAKQRFQFVADVDNTGACTINISGLGAKSIKLADGSDPHNGAIQANSVADIIYDGTNFILINPSYADVLNTTDLTVSGAFTSQGIDDNANATAITIDSSENIGIGTTPSAWGSAYSAINLSARMTAFASASTGNIAYNAYHDGTNWRRIEADTASLISCSSGSTVEIYAAATGAADSVITWARIQAISDDGGTAFGNPSGGIPATVGGVNVELLQVSGTTVSPSNSFSAHKNGTSQTNITGIQLVTFGTERFDTNSDFASSRHTPTIAGKYSYTASLQWGSYTAGDTLSIYIYKNGSAYAQYFTSATSATTFDFTQITAIIDMNGSTDYVEVYAQNSARNTSDVTGSSNLTRFEGCLV